ncbi:MAG: hypothetical protein AVDCRST_MAG96-3690 [uncultured Segetibacter sp.]|uniref:Uncharacterized protein n=1 Tax=uncultured Segetibacter sp. TaxID=481133 RepID=A0A6J4TUV0_9BACT|nr:MAG: hypothetical protein AVDCRST_MAG96-3690 [uncultured Segetibacter sp.]
MYDSCSLCLKYVVKFVKGKRLQICRFFKRQKILLKQEFFKWNLITIDPDDKICPTVQSQPILIILLLVTNITISVKA